jgi:hypothetical protein
MTGLRRNLVFINFVLSTTSYLLIENQIQLSCATDEQTQSNSRISRKCKHLGHERNSSGLHFIQKHLHFIVIHLALPFVNTLATGAGVHVHVHDQMMKIETGSSLKSEKRFLIWNESSDTKIKVKSQGVCTGGANKFTHLQQMIKMSLRDAHSIRMLLSKQLSNTICLVFFSREMLNS